MEPLVAIVATVTVAVVTVAWARHRTRTKVSRARIARSRDMWLDPDTTEKYRQQVAERRARDELDLTDAEGPIEVRRPRTFTDEELLAFVRRIGEGRL